MISPTQETLWKKHSDAGIQALKQGHYAEAEQHLLAAQKEAKRFGDQHPKFAQALNNLAGLYAEQGKYTEAEPLHRRSLTMLENALGPEHPDVATSLNNLAMLYHDQGKYTEAEPLYRRALTIWETVLGPEHPDVATGLNNLAGLYHEKGQYAAAEPLYRRALANWEKALGPEHPRVAQSLNNLALLYRHQREYSAAESLYRRALTIWETVLGPEHPDVAASLNNLAGLYHHQGQYAAAEPLFLRSFAIWEKALGPEHPRVAISLNNLAALHFAQANTTKALSFSRKAIAIYRGRLVPIPEDLSAGSLHEQVSKRVLFTNFARVVTRVIEEHPNRRESLIREAFEVGQLAQASKTAHAVTQMSIRSAAGDPDLSRLVRVHQDALNQWRVLDKARGDRYKNGQEVAALNTQFATLEDRIKAQTLALRQRFPEYIELNDPQPVMLAEVQQLLAPDEALLVYLVSQAESYLWVVRNNLLALHRIEIGQPILEKAITSLRTGLDPSEMEIQWDRSGIPKRGSITPFDVQGAHALYTQLIAPALPSLEGVRHLLVVPNAELQSLPLGILVSTAPKQSIGRYSFSQYRRISWLADQYALTTLPAVGSLRALRRFASNDLGNQPFTGFGDPVLKGPPGPIKGISLTSLFKGPLADVDKLRTLNRLPKSAKELQALARYLKADEKSVYLQARATEDNVKSLGLKDQRVLAFSTHALVAHETQASYRGPAEPALVLTPPKIATERDDGLLTASEVAQLTLNADWVILSACNTAAAGSRGTESLSGLAKAFFYAGSRSLLVSHWNVEESAAMHLTIGMFDRLAQQPGLRRSSALQHAMQALRKNTVYAHPLFWAPFVVVGEGGVIARSGSGP